MQPDALTAELLQRAAVEQALRRDLLSAQRADAQTDLASRLDETDIANTRWLAGVVHELGWPTAAKVGPEASRAAWLLVQHSDHDLAFQQRCLSLMVAEGADAAQVALLTDRVRVALGQPQVYGTQCRATEQGWVPFPIEDEADVDSRRAAAGLPAIAEYLAGLPAR